ncbi:MAG: serine hydrolase domain-containing protein, partial [Chitinophagaceae bacterium]
FKSIPHANRDSTHLTAHRGTITIKHLLSHTSGLPEEIPADVRKQFTKPVKSLADFVAMAAKVPLLFYPGTEYNYSDLGYYVLGRLIEVASGMSYEKFVSERLFKPLNMLDSYVLLPDSAKKYRIATAYEVKESKLQLSPYYDHSYMSWLTFPRPSWSMFSTASDLLSFYQMLLQGGNYRGKRILSAKSVTLMTSAQVKNILNRPGFGYGLGVNISLAPTDTTSAVSFGSYGHGGLLGTRGWVDPEWNMIRIFLIQRLPTSPAEAFIGQERDVFMKLARSAATKR